MKYLTLLVTLLMCVSLSAEQPSLESVMKEMALSYKHAKTAETSEQLLVHLSRMEQALMQSKTIGFKREAEKSMEGIDKVLTHISNIKKNAHNLAAAKKQLNQIDKLRKHYHKIHEPSFWQLLFAK